VGDIRYQNQQLGAGSHVENPYYHQNEQKALPQSHDMKRSMVYDAERQIWICHNSRNLAHLDQMLQDIPLIINSESNVGIFCMTEKSLWPLVLGKLTMIQARPRFMQWFSEYVGYDFSSYLDLEYDSIDGWTPLCHRRRAECMIDRNLYLIKHAREAWYQVRYDLQNLSQSLPQRIYQKFCGGLDLIK
jgi:hypothetical protein